MRPRHRKLFITLILVAVLACAAWLLIPRGPPEPVYNGKSLSQWLEQYQRVAYANDSISKDAQLEASNAIRQIGTNAIPTLIQMMATHDSRVKRLVVRHFPVSWADRLHFGKAYQRYRGHSIAMSYKAERGFRILGPDGAAAIPALSHIMRTSDNPYARHGATLSLADIGLASRAALSELVQALSDPELAVRMSADDTIGWIYHDWESDSVNIVVTELSSVLKESNVDPYGAIYMLGRFGPAARPAIPAILPYLNSNVISTYYQSGYRSVVMRMPSANSNDYRISTAARRALQSIDPANSALLDPKKSDPYAIK